MENARSLDHKLKSLKQDFKNHQLAIIDRTDGEEALAEEQQALDGNDDIVSALNIRLQRLMSHATSTRVPEAVRVAGKQLTMLQTDLESINTTVAGLRDTEDGIECTLEEYRDRVSDIKAELAKLKASLLSSEAAPGDTVMVDLRRVERLAFDCLLAVKKRLLASSY